MELYMMNRQHGRMILESVENGPLIWPTIEENGVTRPRKYSELSAKMHSNLDWMSSHKYHSPRIIWVATTRGPILLKRSLLSKDDKLSTKVKLEQFQVNTKLLNTLPPEWSKFMIDVKLYGSPYHSQQYSNNQSSTPLSITYPSNDYQSSVHHNVYSPPSSIPQMEYAPTVNQQQQQPEFPQLDSGLIVPVFKQGDDPIDAINYMMSFLSAVVTSRYPTTSNQLRNSSNPRQQATINDGRVTLQLVQGDKFLLLLVPLGPTLQEQVEAILGNKGLLFVTTAKGGR
ncbi:hypothetical protein Tco_1476247 [Tanacetum coccineum]